MDPELLSLDRLPLPSLKVYTCLSFLAASFSMYYIGTESGSALKKLSDAHDSCQFNLLVDHTAAAILDKKPDNLLNSPLDSATPSFSHSLGLFARYLANEYWWPHEESGGERVGGTGDNNNASQQKNVTESDCLNEDYQQLTWQLLHWASQQPHCVWPLVNLLYCLLILGSHAVQKSIFGSLRLSEEENIKDQFWNLVFYKVVFVFGVVDVKEIEDAVGWCFFVSVIGFLQLARQLCQERHNYLIMINDTSKCSEARRHRILRLLVFIFATSIVLFLTVALWFLSSSPKEFSNDFLDLKSILIPFTRPFDDPSQVAGSQTGYDFNLGLHSAIFMLSEITLLILQTLHALTMCIFEQKHFRHKTWKWGPFDLLADKTYGESDEEDLYLCASQNINYKFEIISLLFDLIHHLHMFICCNLFLSMTSLIVALQMKLRVKQIHRVLKRRNSFTSLNEHIDRYPDVDYDTGDEKDKAASCENCAICWESLASQKSKKLPCKHIFHKTCLRKWLLVSMHCPTCRMSLLSEKELELRRENEPPRIYYVARPAYGIMGLLHTGQTLLDLFGGWDPLPDEYSEEEGEEEETLEFSEQNNTTPQQPLTPPIDTSSVDLTAQEGTSRARKNN